MSEQETDGTGSNAPDVRQGASERLSAARESLGLTQKEVADKLFLTTSFIAYIDNGEFDRIPKPAFVKGYLRTYARVVGLSGDEIVAIYEAELEATEPDPEIRGVTEEKVGTAAITGPVLQSGLIGLVGLVVVISLVWYLVSDDEESTAAPITLDSEVGIQNPGPAQTPDFDFVAAEAESVDNNDESASSENQAETELADDVEAAQPTPAASAERSDDQSSAIQPAQPDEPVPTIAGDTAPSERQQADEPISTDSDEAVIFERTSDGDRSVIKVDAGGFDQLVMSFSDECWVEVSDSERGLVYNDLNRATDMLTVYGHAPFSVLLGKATVVEMIYNGRPFDLAQHTGPDSTAKFTVAD